MQYLTKKTKLILSRDRFGEKPLFYSKINNNFFLVQRLNILNL